LVMALFLSTTQPASWQHPDTRYSVLEVSLLTQATPAVPNTQASRPSVTPPAPPKPVTQATPREQTARLTPPPAKPQTPPPATAITTPASEPKQTAAAANHTPSATSEAAATDHQALATATAATAPATPASTASTTSASAAQAGGETTAAMNRKAQPDYAYNPPPEYPMVLRENNIAGIVHMQVLVQTDGSPREINVHKSSGYRLMDEAAVRAVKRWRFLPAIDNGRTSNGWVEFPIRFTLTNS
jgi:protein TonB